MALAETVHPTAVSEAVDNLVTFLETVLTPPLVGDRRNYTSAEQTSNRSPAKTWRRLRAGHEVEGAIALSN